MDTPLLEESLRFCDIDEPEVDRGFSSSELSIGIERTLGVCRAKGGFGGCKDCEYCPREEVDSIDRSRVNSVVRCNESKLL